MRRQHILMLGACCRREAEDEADKQVSVRGERGCFMETCLRLSVMLEALRRRAASASAAPASRPSERHVPWVAGPTNLIQGQIVGVNYSILTASVGL